MPRRVGRTTLTVLATIAALSAALASGEREVGACPCSGPETTLLGPERIDGVPLNAKVRVEVRRSPSPAGMVVD